MLHKETKRSHLLKLLALLPVIGTALVLNARTVTDVVYNEPQKKQVSQQEQTTAQPAVLNEVVVVEKAPAVQEDTKPDTALVVVNRDASSTNDNVFDVVEEMPEFPGGQIAMLEYLSKNVRYPDEAHKAGKQGRVIATFVVEKDGSITNAKVVRSIDPLLDAEALRVISSMPNWIPGKQNGKPVAVKYTVPVSFKVHDYYSLCPSINLMKDDAFCALSTCKTCTFHVSTKKYTGTQWQTMWQKFFNNVTHIYVFSHSSKQIFTSKYSVPEEKIISRYKRSLRNLPKLVRIADHTRVIDNSGEEPHMICEIINMNLTIWESDRWR